MTNESGLIEGWNLQNMPPHLIRRRRGGLRWRAHPSAHVSMPNPCNKSQLPEPYIRAMNNNTIPTTRHSNDNRVAASTAAAELLHALVANHLDLINDRHIHAPLHVDHLYRACRVLRTRQLTSLLACGIMTIEQLQVPPQLPLPFRAA